MFNLRNIILLTFAIAFSSGILAGDVEDGNAAYLRKDYITALVKWKKAAEKNNTYAQRQVGNMYIAGEGVKKRLC